jgi:branched-chain amino acid transport system permease protein
MNKQKSFAALLVVIALCCGLGVVRLLDDEFWSATFVLILINILLTSSLRTIFILDEISLGHVGFSLIGAYTAALMSLKWGVPFWAALLLAGSASALVALILAYPFMKLKGIYFSILTFMTAEIFRLIAYNWVSLTGGSNGLANLPPATPLSLPAVGTVTFTSMSHFYYLTFGVVVISLAIIYSLERSHLSAKWRAIRDADNLAMSVGINVMKYKMINFTIACFFAGIAGALFAFYQRGLSADLTGRFGVMTSLTMVVYIVVGGKNLFFGPMIGVLVIELFSELARPINAYRPMLIGAIAIVVALRLPEGIGGGVRTLFPSQFKSDAAKGR